MPRTLVRIAGCLLACCAFWPTSAGADEPAYFVERMIDLELTEGTLQANDIPQSGPHAWNWRLFWLPTYIVLDGPGEAYWSDAMDLDGVPSSDLVVGRQALFVRLPKAGVDATGQLFYLNRDVGEYRKVRFKIAADKAKADFRQPFYSAKAGHYRHLLESEIPGGAWFRHQMQVARAESGPEKDASERPARARVNRDTTDFNTTFALFSGGRAISENLQLDRTFTTLQNGTADVPIEKLVGITVAEIDWSKLTESKRPQLDPLAGYIPADQHAVFFPSFAALLQLADEADRQSTLVLEAAEPRAEDFRVVERYQRQLGLQTTALGRMLGPQVIASVALTGGDPYFRLGTDVAVIFEPTKDAAALQTLLATQIALNSAGEKQLSNSSGEVQGVKYQAWTSPGRRVSSYLAVVDGMVVVTNSPAQLRRLDDTRQGRQKPIDSLAEYRFFRDRYRRGDAAEAALLFLSDATIRRWCGPQWRIGDSRRTRDLAVLSEAQAAAVPELVAGSGRQGPVESGYPLSGGERIELTPQGVASTAIGTLEFLTPIGERPPTMVSRAEADAYQTWRDGYQRNFRWAFDPI
ncbi:MAG TPA: hypothetical protein VHY20_07055, partial [Pirellulales bacterium]|nr:hypothetical protein [Pirellulales bacterium]